MFWHLQQGILNEGEIDGTSIEELEYDPSIEADPTETIEECVLRAVHQMNQNWFLLEKAFNIDGLSCFLESGDPLLQAINEASSDGFFEKVKSWFKKLWEKIQEIFKNALMYFNSKFASSSSFYNKYKKSFYEALHSKTFSNFKFNGYPFNGMITLVASGGNLENGAADVFDTDNFYNAIAKLKELKGIATHANSGEFANDTYKIKLDSDDKFKHGEDGSTNDYEKDQDDKLKEHRKAIDDYRKKLEFGSDEKNDILEAVRQQMYKQVSGSASSSPLTSDEYKQELNEYLKGNNAQKEELEIDSHSLTKAFEDLKDYNKLKTRIEKWMRNIKRALDKDIKTVDKLQKNHLKLIRNKDEHTGKKDIAGLQMYYVSAYIDILKSMKVIATQTQGILLSNLKEYMGQTRAIVAKVITYNAAKHESAGSVFGSVAESSSLYSFEFN